MNLEIQGKLQIGHNNLRVFSGKVSIFPIFVLRGIQDFTSALCRKIFPVHLNVQKGKNGRGRTINIVTGTNDLQNITIFLAASIIHQISSHSKKQKKKKKKRNPFSINEHSGLTKTFDKKVFDVYFKVDSS